MGETLYGEEKPPDLKSRFKNLSFFTRTIMSLVF